MQRNVLDILKKLFVSKTDFDVVYFKIVLFVIDLVQTV